MKHNKTPRIMGLGLKLYRGYSRVNVVWGGHGKNLAVQFFRALLQFHGDHFLSLIGSVFDLLLSFCSPP